MDKYYELMVEKQKSAKTYLAIAGIYIVGIFLASSLIFVGLFFVPAALGLVFMATIGIIIGTWYLSTKLFVEYEYITTNNDIDIDKITAQRLRKRIISFNCQNVEAGGKYDPTKKQSSQISKTIFAQKNDSEAYYLIIKHTTFGKTLVVFSPDKRMIDGMRQYLPRDVYSNFSDL